MLDADRFDPDRWKTDAETVPRPSTKKRPPRKNKPGRFLKGPIPWPWLVKAMAIPGKALAVGLILWQEAGCEGTRTVYFSLARAVAEGIPESTSRRAIRTLESAGLVEVQRNPGCGLEVTILDEPVEQPRQLEK